VAGWPGSHIDIVHLARRHAWLQRHGSRGDLRDVGVWWAFQRAACRGVSGGRHPRAHKRVRTVPGYARERAVRKDRTILAGPCTFDLLERGHSKYKQLCSQTVPQKPSGIEVVLLVFGSACHPVVFPARFWVRAAITGQIVSSQLFITVCRNVGRRGSREEGGLAKYARSPVHHPANALRGAGPLPCDPS
jgi:hypothetical protein